MAFTEPFPGETHRPLTRPELVRALRLDIAAEEDAIALYEAHAGATSNETARKTLQRIADEEKVHVGEFLTLLVLLEPGESGLLGRGAREVATDAELAEIVRQLLGK